MDNAQFLGLPRGYLEPKSGFGEQGFYGVLARD